MNDDILKGKTLLVVDDEPDLRDIVASELEFMGAFVHQAENIKNAQKILSDNSIDLIISDIRMPGGTGIDLLDIVKGKDSTHPPVVLITGFADITTEDAFAKGAEALLNKPFKLDDLIKLVSRYTSSFEERFSESVQSLKLIHPGPVRLGRGGFSAQVDTDGKRVDVGEIVNFSFAYEGLQFEGKGLCKWVKLGDTDQKKSTTMMGVEFMSLGPESLKNFEKINSARALVAYIPSFKT